MRLTHFQQAVAAELVSYGRELAASGAAQVGDSFSGVCEADELLESDPNAFLIGLLFTQGIPAERAWAGPWLLSQRMGGLAPAYLASHPEEVRSAFQQAPMLHRFKETLPRWVSAAALILCERYGGDASRVWPPGSSVPEVIERLSEFPGIGRKKAVMGAEILMRHFGVELEGKEHGQVAYDIQVRRVFLRSGLVDTDTRAAIEAVALAACPESPGTLDLPAWLIGRETCRPRQPLCDRCRLAAVCPRRTWLTPQGVGVRQRTSG